MIWHISVEYDKAYAIYVNFLISFKKSVFPDEIVQSKFKVYTGNLNFKILAISLQNLLLRIILILSCNILRCSIIILLFDFASEWMKDSCVQLLLLSLMQYTMDKIACS